MKKITSKFCELNEFFWCVSKVYSSKILVWVALLVFSKFINAFNYGNKTTNGSASSEESNQ